MDFIDLWLRLKDSLNYLSRLKSTIMVKWTFYFWDLQFFTVRFFLTLLGLDQLEHLSTMVNTFPFRLNDSFLVLLFGVEIPSGNEHVCFVIIRSNSTQRGNPSSVPWKSNKLHSYTYARSHAQWSRIQKLFRNETKLMLKNSVRPNECGLFLRYLWNERNSIFKLI